MLDLLTATRVCVHLAAQCISTHHHVADSFLFTPMLPIATGCALAKGCQISFHLRQRLACRAQTQQALLSAPDCAILHHRKLLAVSQIRIPMALPQLSGNSNQELVGCMTLTHLTCDTCLQLLKSDARLWTSKYARGGSVRKPSARKIYIVVDALQGHLTSNG